LWTAHLDRYRDARTELTAEQREVLDSARTIATDRVTFERGRTAGLERRLRGLREVATSAFGKDEARVVLATLGPPERISPRDDDDYCENEWDCDHVDGCGSFWQYTCDGLCTTFN
jgi:hypothetical protein